MPDDVAVTLILDEAKILLVYNEKWSAFTLPMTKRKRPDSANAGDADDGEAWLDAAARNVVECLGRPSRPEPVLEDFVPEGRFSRRRQAQAIYRYKTFKVNWDKNDKIVAKAPTVWLTASQILTAGWRPISETAIDIIRYERILEALGFSI